MKITHWILEINYIMLQILIFGKCSWPTILKYFAAPVWFKYKLADTWCLSEKMILPILGHSCISGSLILHTGITLCRDPGDHMWCQEGFKLGWSCARQASYWYAVVLTLIHVVLVYTCHVFIFCHNHKNLSFRLEFSRTVMIWCWYK